MKKEWKREGKKMFFNYAFFHTKELLIDLEAKILRNLASWVWLEKVLTGVLIRREFLSGTFQEFKEGLYNPFAYEAVTQALVDVGIISDRDKDKDWEKAEAWIRRVLSAISAFAPETPNVLLRDKETKKIVFFFESLQRQAEEFLREAQSL